MSRTDRKRDQANVDALNNYMDSKGIPVEERDLLPFGD